MNINKSLDLIEKEANSLKTAFGLVGENILIFEYEIEMDESNLEKEYLTLETDDGSETIAFVPGATRVLSHGLNTWRISIFSYNIGEKITIKSLRKCRVVFHD